MSRLPWSAVTVWASPMIEYGCISIGIGGSLLIIYAYLSITFPKRGEKNYFALIPLSIVNGIGRVLLDMLEGDPEYGLEDFFPRDYLARKPEECRNSIDELYEIICSRAVRDYIKPKYEHLLYIILIWWKECRYEDEELLLN